ANQQVFMSAGDMVVLLDGSAHSLSDSVSSPRVPFWSLSYELDEPEPSLLIRHGGEGPETLVMAGAIVFDGWQIGPWLKNLPKLIHIQADSPAIQHSITPIRSMLVRERRSTEPGARTAEAELVKLLFLNILRFAITQTTAEHKGCPRSPVALMFDAQLRALVEAVHENPGDLWSVVQMASKAGMSRTKFIERFTQVAGESPASYLTRLRMTKAVDLLETSDATLEQIAERVGYGSEAAFGSAFKRKLGVAPGVYR